MKTKNLKRKLKTQPGGSLKPVGSEFRWRVSMTERHSTDVKAKTRREAIAAAERDGFTGGEYTCLGFTARRIPNARGQAQPLTATVPDGKTV